MLAQHVEDLRHADEHRHAARFDLRDDVHGVVAAHEHNDARQHRRHEGRHRLAEHVAERKQVQKAQREKRLAPLAVLQHLALDRHRVREHVAVRDDDALGFSRRARREDDLCNVVTCDRHRGRIAVAPVELVQLPDRLIRVAERRDVLSDENESRCDDGRDARQEIG